MASGEGELELGSKSDLDVMFVCFGESWPFWGLRYYVDSLSGALFKQMYSKQGLQKLLLSPPGSFRFTRTQTSSASSFHPRALVMGALSQGLSQCI